MVMRFLLVCEGATDRPLASHIQRLLFAFGRQYADFEISTVGRTLACKVQNGLKLSPYFDLLFVHRDADNIGWESRRSEIEHAVRESLFQEPSVPVIPVRMTEAWLLLDEMAIRRAVRKPDGRRPLVLPTPNEVERRANPRDILNAALLDASEMRGRRRIGLRQELPTLRRNLLETLPVGGPLEQLESWRRFRDDALAALDLLSS